MTLAAHRRTLRRTVTLGVLLAAVPSLALAVPKLKSRWTDQAIVVDGVADEWQGNQTRFKKAKVHVGVAHDGEFLYVSLVTDEPLVNRQIVMQGLTLWFDPRGGKGQIFGVRFPLGLRATGALQRMRGSPDGTPPDREQRRRIFEEAFSNLAILGPGEEDYQEVAVGETPGVEVRMNTAGETTVYELKVPLAGSEELPYAIGFEAGQALGIGIVSPKRPSGGRRGGGFGGGGGGAGSTTSGNFGAGRVSGSFGDGGAPAGAAAPPQPKPLDIWTTVQVAPAQNP